MVRHLGASGWKQEKCAAQADDLGGAALFGFENGSRVERGLRISRDLCRTGTGQRPQDDQSTRWVNGRNGPDTPSRKGGKSAKAVVVGGRREDNDADSGQRDQHSSRRRKDHEEHPADFLGTMVEAAGTVVKKRAKKLSRMLGGKAPGGVLQRAKSHFFHLHIYENPIRLL
jgi:hypothetical protein